MESQEAALFQHNPATPVKPNKGLQSPKDCGAKEARQCRHKPMSSGPYPPHLGAGAKEVVMTDREPLALQCALRSAEASGISSVAAFGGAREEQHGEQASTSAAQVAAVILEAPQHQLPVSV